MTAERTTFAGKDTTSFMVAGVMKDLGYNISFQQSFDGYFSILASDKERDLFWKLIDLPDFVVIWHALEGFDVSEVKEFQEVKWTKNLKNQIRAFGFIQRAEILRRVSDGRSFWEQRAKEAEIKSKQIIKGKIIEVENVKSLVGRLVKKKLEKSAY